MDDVDSSSGATAVRGQDVLANYWNVLAIVSGLTLLQAATSGLLVVVALNLKTAGVPTLAVGAVASAYSFGFMLGAVFCPREIARIGHIRSYALFAAIGAIVALSFTLKINVALWALAQAAMGACSSGLYTAGESWVANSAPSNRRGALLGFYHVVSKVGSVTGPFLIAWAEPAIAGFTIVAALFAASLVPVTATNRAQPELQSAEPIGPGFLWKHAPAAVIAAFIAGAVNNSVAQLYPLYIAVLNLNGPIETSARFNAALLAGAMATLLPAGWLSDRMDRRTVVAILACIGVVASAGLVYSGHARYAPGIWLFAILFGAGSYSYYGVAVAHAADRARPEQTTAMIAGLLMVWGAGSVAGPVVAGFVMSLKAGALGLFLFSGVGLAILTAAMAWRRSAHEPVSEAEKEPFNVVPATSLAIAEIDPRGADIQLDLFTDNEEATR